MNKKNQIETKRLILRHFKRDDALEMFNNWASDPEVAKYVTWNAHKDVSETEYILNIWLEEYKDPKTVRFGITLKDSGELIGSIDIVRIDDGVPEIGYCSSRKYWNHGYMTEAVEAFTEYVFSLGYKEIVIEAVRENIGSNRVIQKNGFKFMYQEEREMSPLKKEKVVINSYKKTII